MRRVSLALALVGAVAATGCGGNRKPASDGGAKGTAGSNFTITVNNQGPGTVTSTPSPVGSKDSANPCAANSTCTWTFAWNTAVVLTGNVGTYTDDQGQTQQAHFNGFFGACSGATCSLAGNADKYVVAYFSNSADVHPNFNDPAVHSAAYNAYSLDCASCHGPNAGPGEDFTTNAGQGLAIACKTCHAPATVGEKCQTCHYKTGSDHQARYNDFANGINPATSKFAANIVSVVTSGTGPFTSTVTFTLTKAGSTTCAAPANLKQKTMYFVAYDPATKKFPTPSYKQSAALDPSGEIGGSNTESINFSFGSMTLTNPTTCTYTMVKSGLPTDPLANANAFAYGYFGDSNVAGLEGNLNPGGRHYALMDNMISVAKVLKGTIDYASTATVTGCERCHGAPYSKHGYRQATVAGLNDFVACKACHTDFRRGTDAGWYLPVNEPALASGGFALTADLKLKYAYVANVMNDTHNSHAMEFAYPQSMANCTTCHEGKLDRILTDANFNGLVCKSCHATENAADPGGERAPSFKGPVLGPKLAYHSFNWQNVYDASGNLIAPAGTVKETVNGVDSYMQCNECHADDIGSAPGVHDGAIDGKGPNLFGSPVPLFKDIHSGRIASVYAADGSKYSATVTSKVDSINVNKAAKTVTVVFSMAGVPTNATVTPTIVGSVYGYNTKDFVVSGHGTAADTKRVLEWSGTDTARLSVTGSGPWTVVANLSDAVTFPQVANGSATKMELGFLPTVKLADGTTSIAVSGLTATIDLTVDGAGTAVADQYGKSIVDAGKCNKCHEALGTTFHSPNYGSAGVVGCRLCHWVGTGSSHLEMQSRSIDSFVHAIHSFQYMDSKSVNFADAFAAFEYGEHIDSVYPNFTIQNCESCHNAGTYNVPAINRSLPSISSASWAFTGKTRSIPAYVASPLAGIPAVVTGPADRACGSCHRATLINEDDFAGLTSFNAHTDNYGIRVTKADGTSATATELSSVMQGLKDAGLLP